MTVIMPNEAYRANTKEGTELIIREARSDEDYYKAYPVLLQLIPDLDMQTYSQRVFVARATGYRMFMAEMEGDVVGVIGMIHNHNLHDGFVTYIEQVVVDKDCRGKGVGSHLLEFAENRAKEEGCDEIELDVDQKDGKQAEDFYMQNGYKLSGKYLYKDLRTEA
jgi:GNAT superfamily N-acetyltransferase